MLDQSVSILFLQQAQVSRTLLLESTRQPLWVKERKDIYEKKKKRKEEKKKRKEKEKDER